MGCWNITSWNNKDQEVILEMNKHRIDICCLAETKKKGKGNSKYENYILIYSGRSKSERAQSGIGLLIHEKFEQNISDVKYISDRLLVTSLKLDTNHLHIISVYAPDISKPREETEDFYKQLQNLLDEIPPQDKVVLMGDFNARIGNEVINGVKQRFNEDVINSNGEALIDLCAQNELRINNTFYPYKMQHKYTWSNTRHQQSMIDYIISNRNVHPSQIMDVRTLGSANVGTDHNLILCKFRNNSKLMKRKPPQFKEKLNMESLEDSSTKYLYKQRLEHKIAANPISVCKSVEEAWCKLSENITKAAEEALGTRRVNINAQKNTKPWFNDNVRTLAQEKRDAYLKYRSNKSMEEYQRYVSVRNNVNAQITEIKRYYWEKFSKDMEHDLYGGQRKVWNMLRNRKKPVNEYIQTGTIAPETWVNHFKELYHDDNSTETGEEQETVDEQPLINYKVDIEESEVEMFISKLKNRKSPGIDNITNEMIKYGGEKLTHEITTLFQRILKEGTVPEMWKSSITIPIFKKGSKMNPKNYRGISLLSTTLKLMSKIIAKKINDQLGISEEQQGFRQNRSTIDAIFIIRQIIEKAIEFNKPAFMCFVDLTQAFDRIRLPDVLRILKIKGIQPQIIKIIEQLNSNNTTRIMVSSNLTQSLPVATGIRQGDSLSPILFNIIMDEIIQDVKRGVGGYRIGDSEIKIICYADDAVIIAENEDDLQRMLLKFNTTAKTLNMRMSLEKTKTMTISKEPLRCKLEADGTVIEQVMSFNYLGTVLSSDRNTYKEARAQASKATAVSGYLRDIIWRNKYMNIDSKTRIYKACVRPILTYAVETRAETRSTKRTMRTAEMRSLRAIAGVTLRDHVRSETIRSTCKVQDVVRWVRARRRGWHQHVTRMEDQRLAKVAFEGQIYSKRPRGRPPKRWKECWTSSSQDSE